MFETPSHRDLSMRDLQPQPGDQLCYVWAGPQIRPTLPPTTAPPTTAPPTPDTLPNGTPAPDTPTQAPDTLPPGSTKPPVGTPDIHTGPYIKPRPAGPTFDQVAKLVQLLQSDTSLPDSFKLAILRHALSQLPSSSVLSARSGLHDGVYGTATLKTGIAASAAQAIGGGPATEAASPPAPPAPGTGDGGTVGGETA